MIGRLFWLIGAVLLAVIVHLSYVLFGPRVAMAGLEREAAGFAGGTNRMQVLNAEQYAALFGGGAAAVAATCAYDLSRGDVMLHAAFLPGMPWTLTLYAGRGNGIYAVNDVQAGANQVTVRIRQVSSLKRLLGGDEEAGIVNDGWRVETGETKGIAVLWMPLPDKAYRQRAEEAMSASSCRTAG